MKLPIVIPSYNRADKILTKNVLEDCILCVPESQVSVYREHNPECEILSHPDTLLGISPKFQWIYDYFGDHFLIADDINQMVRLYRGNNSPYPMKLNKRDATAVINDTYNLCKEMGIKLFAFNKSPNPMSFQPAKPISLQGFPRGSWGLLKDDRIHFPNISDMLGSDEYLRAIHTYYNRYSWIDNRFSFTTFETEKTQGGCADFRTEKTREEGFYQLKKYFGDAIIHKAKSGCKMNLLKWEKTLRIPY